MKKNMSDDIRKTVREGHRRRGINYKSLLKRFIILLIIIGVAFLAFNAVKNRKIKVKDEQVSNYNYFLMSENGKIGIIDREGKVIINAEYDYIQIPNPEKPIFVCLFDYDSSKQIYKSKVLNDKNEEVFTNFSNITAIPKNDISNSWNYQTSILKYNENEKYGIITISGKKITNAIYDSIESLENKDGVLKIKKDDEFGLIELNGSEIIKPLYYSITSDGYYTKEEKYEKAGYIVSIKKDTGYEYGYISYTGKELLNTEYSSLKRINSVKSDSTPYLITILDGKMGICKNSQNIIKNEYNSIEYDTTNNLLEIQKNGKYGVYDLYGNMILPIQYDSINFAGTIINATKDGKNLVFDASGNIKKDYKYTSFKNTDSPDYYIVVDGTEKYGVVDSRGNTLIDNKYSYIEYLYDKFFIYTDNGKSGVIDYTGRKILDNKYDAVQNIIGTKIVQALNGSTSEIYNNKMEKITETTNMHIYVKDNYIQVLSENILLYIDYEGKILKSQDIFTNNSIFASEKNGKWGYIDISGNVVIDYIYDMALDINEYGFGAIKKDGKWGVINKDKQIILEPTYKITDVNPTFIGEYYREMQDYSSYCFVKDTNI